MVQLGYVNLNECIFISSDEITFFLLVKSVSKIAKSRTKCTMLSHDIQNQPFSPIVATYKNPNILLIQNPKTYVCR